MKGPTLIFMAFIAWSFIRTAMKSAKKVKTAQQRNGQKTAKAPRLQPERQRSSPKQETAKPQIARKNIELLDNDRDTFDTTQVYSEIDPAESEGSHFVLNRGMSKRDRSSASDDIARAKADKAALPTMLTFTKEDVKRYVIMKEVFGAPRAIRPYQRRKSYYTASDISRD